jgi:serine/threonine protein kinase
VGMADENLISLQPGTVIAGRYEVVKCLGAGSMGLVYACRHRELAGHLVAVKVLFPEVAQDNTAAARFRNEIVASYGVSHPNVVRAYEYFRDGDLVAYTMEYVGGGDLADRLVNGEPLPIREVVRLFCQISSGVQAIHDAGIVHRDLKPENILLTPNNDVKITDFGIARTGHGPKLTEHGGVVGTIDYVSPEYLEKGQVDARSDIYALGVLAYEMITGESPFKGDSVIATMTMRLRSDAKPPSSLRTDCPAELDRIILRALERNPDLRYQSAIEIFYDLQGLIDPRDRMGGANQSSGAQMKQAMSGALSSSVNSAATRTSVSTGLVSEGLAQNHAVQNKSSENSSVQANSAATSYKPSAYNDKHLETGRDSYNNSMGAISGKPRDSETQSPRYYGGGAAEQIHPAFADESNSGTMRQPLKMESVLSYSDLVSKGSSVVRAPNRISVGEGGLDKGRIRTLSASVGELQRSGWFVDIVLVAVAALIGVGVGVAGLFLWKPELFEKKPTLGGDYDIRIFDNNYRP